MTAFNNVQAAHFVQWLEGKLKLMHIFQRLVECATNYNLRPHYHIVPEGLAVLYNCFHKDARHNTFHTEGFLPMAVGHKQAH